MQTTNTSLRRTLKEILWSTNPLLQPCILIGGGPLSNRDRIITVVGQKPAELATGIDLIHDEMGVTNPNLHRRVDVGGRLLPGEVSHANTPLGSTVHIHIELQR